MTVLRSAKISYCTIITKKNMLTIVFEGGTIKIVVTSDEKVH